MIFYGWGTKSKSWPMADGAQVTCVYKFLSLMFIFKIVRKKTWYVGQQETPRTDVEARYGDDAPKLDIWTSYGLPIAIAVIVLLFIVL